MPPKSAKSGALDNATITVSYKDYMESQNEVIAAVNEHYNVASSIMMASSRSMQTFVAAMLHIRKSAKTALGESPEGLEKYPALASLLSKDQRELYNPMAATADAAEKPKEKKKRKKKDPNAPKRPQTAFFLYLDAKRDSVKKELGDTVKPGDVAKEQAVRWKSLPDAEREIYKALYRANFETYKAEVLAYKASGGNVDEDDLHPAEDDAVVDGAKEKDDAVSSDEEEGSDSESSDEEVEKEPTPPPPKAVPAKKKTKAALAKEAKEAAAAAAKPASPVASPEKSKSPEKKKGKAAETKTAEAKTPAKPATPATEAKKRKGDKEDSPEESKKKKRKSTGAELEEKKKRRKNDHGDDY